MDGTSMSDRRTSLNQLCEANWNLLQTHYEQGTLSLQDRNLLLSEITKLLVTLRDAPLLDSKSSTPQVETTLLG
jgi:hypothetical protein